MLSQNQVPTAESTGRDKQEKMVEGVAVLDNGEKSVAKGRVVEEKVDEATVDLRSHTCRGG